VIKSIFPCLANPADAYNSQHAYILESLADMKSIVLLTDVDNADKLILPLFSICFDVISGSAKGSSGGEIERAIQHNMTNLLVIVVDEVPTLPAEVVDIVLSQFLRVDPRTVPTPTKGRKNAETQDEKQSNFLLKDYPPAYNMAKAICTTCPEKMTSQISQYFNNVIVDASAHKEINGHSKHGGRRISSLEESDDEAEDVKELSKAHQLIRELWRACPEVLQNVIPQLEAELSAESVSLRLLATQTLGDVAAGIGVSGPPALAQMDPTVYPPLRIESADTGFSNMNRLLIPMSPKPFSSSHASAYTSFLGRRQDKSSSVRAAWAVAVGRILLTSAGGIGLSDAEEQILQSGLAQMLGDPDEKVRLAAIEVIERFDYASVVGKFSNFGGVAKPGSVIAVLADRVRDKKHTVREQAMTVLARMWGVAAGDIKHGVQRVRSLLGDIPTKVFDSYYTNDPDTHAILDKVIFDLLLPMSFPPIKASKSTASSQAQNGLPDEPTSTELEPTDPNSIRAQRITTLVKGLDSRSKTVFIGLQARQANFAKVILAYLKACEDYNGGTMEHDEEEIKARLTRLIEAIAKAFPEPSRVISDLWKFAKVHDRRNYQLIRFAMSTENDYKTVVNAIKELTKRINEGNVPSLLDTLTPVVYRCSLLVYNRSHVPEIMKLTRTDDFTLGESAHEVLREISTRNPEVLRTHVQDMCKELEAHAPSAKTPEEASARDTLKACAAFARKFPADIPKNRKFLIALTNYALYARAPNAAKRAVSIVLAVAEKKEMYANDLMRKAVNDCSYKSQHFLARLAAISQIALLAPTAANAESDAVLKIVLSDTLMTNRTPFNKPDEYAWSDTADDETEAKEWSLRVLVNRCRSEEDSVDSPALRELATPLYTILNKLIANEGELLPSATTPPHQKPRLRLAATRSLLKLCRHQRACEGLVTPAMFNSAALVAQDRISYVRMGFITQLNKYLSSSRLHSRWYTVLFLLAYEPDVDLSLPTITWLKSRASFFARQQAQSSLTSTTPARRQNTMEETFARLLSLLAHHPDFPDKSGPRSTYNAELVDYTKYICFYLSTVATEDNLSLIFYIAQRVKQTRDVVADGETSQAEISERLYVLSDLAQALIREWAESMSHQKGHAANANILQTFPGKVHLPASLFGALPNHVVAQEIADKNYLPEDVAGEVEGLVRGYMRGSSSKHGHPSKHHAEKKRKSEHLDVDAADDDDRKAAKKVKKSLPIRKPSLSTTPKTPKPAKKRPSDETPSSEPRQPSRKSARTSNVVGVSYADRDSEEDDAEMEETDQAAAARPVRATPRKTVEDVQEEGEEGSAELADDATDEDGDRDGDGHEEKANEPGEEEAADPAPSSPVSARSKGMASRNIVKGNGVISDKSAFAALDGKAGGVAKAAKAAKAGGKKATPLKRDSPKGKASTTVRETRRTRT
jgi:sister chromatid cohesion protein PDS5